MDFHAITFNDVCWDADDCAIGGDRFNNYSIGSNDGIVSDRDIPEYLSTGCNPYIISNRRCIRHIHIANGYLLVNPAILANTFRRDDRAETMLDKKAWTYYGCKNIKGIHWLVKDLGNLNKCSGNNTIISAHPVVKQIPKSWALP